jgi:hypothetical protein
VFSPQWLAHADEDPVPPPPHVRLRRDPEGRREATPPARSPTSTSAAIKEAMAETIERAKADDPKELRKRIAELEGPRPRTITVRPHHI